MRYNWYNYDLKTIISVPMAHPKVSVLICTRDRPEQFLRSLQSVLQLDFDIYEIIVIDNASTNFAVPKLDYRCKTRFFRQPVAGLSYARNLAVRNAEGEILAWIDDDAVAHRQWLHYAVRNFENSQIACVTGRILPLELKSEWQEKMLRGGAFPVRESPMLFDRTNLHPMSPSPGAGCNLLVRSVIAKQHPFPEWLGPGTPVGAEDDSYLFYKIIRDGWSIFYEPKAIVYHDFDPSEDQYKKKMAHYTTARGAYLAWFLLCERGQRFSTLKHLLKKIFNFGNRNSGVPANLKRKGLLMGPIALLQSILAARRNKDLAANSGTLLAEFPGK